MAEHPGGYVVIDVQSLPDDPVLARLTVMRRIRQARPEQVIFFWDTGDGV